MEILNEAEAAYVLIIFDYLFDLFLVAFVCNLIYFQSKTKAKTKNKQKKKVIISLLKHATLKVSLINLSYNAKIQLGPALRNSFCCN
jgi:hypothetical protein